MTGPEAPAHPGAREWALMTPAGQAAALEEAHGVRVRAVPRLDGNGLEALLPDGSSVTGPADEVRAALDGRGGKAGAR